MQWYGPERSGKRARKGKYPERKLVGNEFPRGEGGVWIYDNPSEYQKYNEAQRNLEVLHAKVAFLHASMMDINVGSSDPVLSPSCM